MILEGLREAIKVKLIYNQAGFRKERSCAVQISTLRIETEQSVEWRSSWYINFVDSDKGFWQCGPPNSLEANEVLQNWWKVCQSYQVLLRGYNKQSNAWRRVIWRFHWGLVWDKCRTGSRQTTWLITSVIKELNVGLPVKQLKCPNHSVMLPPENIFIIIINIFLII